MIAQVHVTAIQPVMNQPSRSSCDPSMLPEHLKDLLDDWSDDLEDIQRGQLAEILLEFVDLFPVPGSTLTGHTEAVEHNIDTRRQSADSLCSEKNVAAEDLNKTRLLLKRC